MEAAPQTAPADAVESALYKGPLDRAIPEDDGTRGSVTQGILGSHRRP